MNTLIGLCTAALVLCGAAALQWIVLQAQYRSALARQRARHVQHQQVANRSLEQAKRQIEQLQRDLDGARREVRLLSQAANRTASARNALERALDEATAAVAYKLPPDGFADTLPSPQIPDYVSLLMR